MGYEGKKSYGTPIKKKKKKNIKSKKSMPRKMGSQGY